MLTDVFYMLRDGVEFHDLGTSTSCNMTNPSDHRLLQRLRDLGVEVEVKKAA